MAAIKETPLGTIRVKANDLSSYKKTKSGWRKTTTDLSSLLSVVKLFKARDNFKVLVDTKDPQFLKGQLSPEGREQGARINILPTGEKLEKAFSLFSPHLTIHDQDSHDHWDVLYQNKGGTFSYVYTLAKRKAHQASKYRKVEQLEKCYGKLVAGVTNALLDPTDYMALPMYTLLTTYMLVGNETYYKAHGHKGLTTLDRCDVAVNGSKVRFNYIGKDGVPISIVKDFSIHYRTRLVKILKQKKKEQFIFTKQEDRLLHEHDFKKAFVRYCGKEFYPHIIRSHFATTQVKQFLYATKRATKQQVQELYLQIAHELGHKKFNKKTQEWQENYAVTVRSYVQPELIKKVEKIIVK